jgi:LAO/AO transport system kinase
MLALGSLVATAAPHGHRGHAPPASATRGPAATGALDAGEDDAWEIPVVECVATTGQGVTDLAQQLARHRVWLSDTPAGQARTRQRSREQIAMHLRRDLTQALLERYAPDIDQAVEEAARVGGNPYGASAALLGRLLADGGAGDPPGDAS